MFAGERRELHFDRLSKGFAQTVHVGKRVHVQIPLHLAELQHDAKEQQDFAGRSHPLPRGGGRPVPPCQPWTHPE